MREAQRYRAIEKWSYEMKSSGYGVKKQKPNQTKPGHEQIDTYLFSFEDSFEDSSIFFKPKACSVYEKCENTSVVKSIALQDTGSLFL